MGLSLYGSHEDDKMPSKGMHRVRLDGSMLVPGHGDLQVMHGRTNAEWQHWVPKTVKPVGERINLTFRRKD